MTNLRLIARLDVKGSNLIKGIQLEGLRVIGDPKTFAQNYYRQGIDEIIYMDTVASLYGRNNLDAIVKHTTEDVFIPMTVGGGIRSVEDADRLLRAGTDKVAINTASIQTPALITEIAERFGSQCMVLSIAARKLPNGTWEAYTDNGRERTRLNVLEWAVRGQQLGAGEILLTSVDREGTRKGFDVDLVRAISDAVPIPVIASGGMGSLEDLNDVVENGHADAIAMAHVLHYDTLSLPDIRERAYAEGLATRTL